MSDDDPLTGPMHAPAHPGAVVRDVIEDSGLTVTDAAKRLGVTRQALNNLINRHSAVSPEMALRLEAVFGGTADNWLRMQTAFDLAQVRQRQAEIVTGLSRFEPA